MRKVNAFTSTCELNRPVGLQQASTPRWRRSRLILWPLARTASSCGSHAERIHPGGGTQPSGSGGQLGGGLSRSAMAIPFLYARNEHARFLRRPFFIPLSTV